MMKKRNFLALMVLAAVQTTFAAPVSQSSAFAVAKQFWAKKGVAVTSRVAAYAPGAKKLTKDVVAPYYVFNAGDNKGYVVVSGDDRTREVLGYADSGSFDYANMPENIKSFLQTYANEITNLDDYNKQLGNQSSNGANQTRKAVHPLLSCLWGQDKAYNYTCPKGPKGERLVTGCVATAMSQVMYKYKWPDAVATEIPAYTSYGKDAKSELAAVPQGTPIEWSKIGDVHTAYDGADKKTAIGNLMLYVGCSVEMTYDTNERGGSGALATSIAPAFNKYFNYSAYTLDRSSVSLADFENILYNEMLADRPVVFCGTVASGGGHCFVIDGYDGKGYFHVNWGWDGASNGYFLISALDPHSTSGIGASSVAGGYDTQQFAIIGIGKNKQASNLATELLTKVTGANGATINVNLSNLTKKGASFEFALGYLDENGKLVAASDAKTKYVASILTQRADPVDLPIVLKGDAMKVGETYNVFVMSRARGTEDWSYNKYSTAMVKKNEDGSFTSLAHDYTKISNINTSASIQVADGEHIVGGIYPAKIKLTNKGTDDYYGRIIVATMNQVSVGSRYQIASTIAVNLKPNEVKEFDATYTLSSAGDHFVSVFSEDGKLIATESVYGVKAAKANSSIASEYAIEKMESNMLYSRTVKGKATFKTTNGLPVVGGYKLVCVDNNTGGIIGAAQPVNLDIPANGSQDVEFSFSGISKTGYYSLILCTPDFNPFSDTQASFSVKVPVVFYKKDGSELEVKPTKTIEVTDDVLAADLSTLGYSVSDVKPNNNPNTLYYSVRSIASLANRNLVKVNSQGLCTAEKITLTDANDFFCPRSFTAKEAIYTRTFNNVIDNNKGWESLSLPFDVTSFTADGQPISWFKTREDTGKQFWLMRYDGQKGQDVFFSYTQAFYSNTPYIMAVPNDLKGKAITFKGTDAKFGGKLTCITSGDEYNYYGTSKTMNDADMYVLNSEGNTFTKAGALSPFRAYFKANNGTAGADQLNLNIIGFDVAGINDVSAEAPFAKAENVFDIQGRKVATVSSIDELNKLPKGIYIVKGKKMVVK